MVETSVCLSSGGCSTFSWSLSSALVPSGATAVAYGAGSSIRGCCSVALRPSFLEACSLRVPLVARGDAGAFPAFVLSTAVEAWASSWRVLFPFLVSRRPALYPAPTSRALPHLALSSLIIVVTKNLSTDVLHRLAWSSSS